MELRHRLREAARIADLDFVLFVERFELPVAATSLSVSRVRAGDGEREVRLEKTIDLDKRERGGLTELASQRLAIERTDKGVWHGSAVVSTMRFARSRVMSGAHPFARRDRAPGVGDIGAHWTRRYRRLE